MSVEVATFAKVLAPEKYGIFPTVAALEVDRPLNPTVAPESVIGQVTEMALCLLLKISKAVFDRQPATPEEAVVQERTEARDPKTEMG